MNMSRRWNVIRTVLPFLLILVLGAALGMGAPASYAQRGDVTATTEPTAPATAKPKLTGRPAPVKKSPQMFERTWPLPATLSMQLYFSRRQGPVSNRTAHSEAAQE